MTRTIVFVYGLLLVGAASTAVGQTPQQRSDSLEVELRRLHARLDSLQRILERLLRAGRDTARVQDELVALRAAAVLAAAEGDTSRRRGAPEPEQFVAQTRNLNRLNPEISVTGDVRVLGNRPGPQRDNVDVREFEFSFQAVLDPFANTKVFLTFEDGAIDLEEGYLYWTGLPGHLRLDLGRFRQQVGELNRWHSHALPESEYPLAYREYFGEEGLVGDGISLFWLAPTGGVIGTQELTLQATLGNNEVLYEDGNRISVLGHLNNFWSLGPSAFLQIGGTAIYGENPGIGLKTSVVGADIRFSWQPPAQAQYRSFTLRAEGYAVDKEFGGVGGTRFGGFVSAKYQLDRRWFLGARYDYVEPLDGGPHRWALVPHLTWWQSEWAYIRAEWQHHDLPAPTGRTTNDRFLIQVVWAIGPHKHETY